jgi:hypothetical protein
MTVEVRGVGGQLAECSGMQGLSERPVSEHPKDVRRWVLESLAVLWTESDMHWQWTPREV